jgi:hypothetical protein
MTYCKFNMRTELKKFLKDQKNKVSADALLLILADEYLTANRAAERRARKIRGAVRRGTNLIIFPKVEC